MSYVNAYLQTLQRMTDAKTRRLQDVARLGAQAQLASAQAWGQLPSQLVNIGTQTWDAYEQQKKIDLQNQRYQQMAEYQDEQNRIAAARQAEVERANAAREKAALVRADADREEAQRKAAQEAWTSLAPGMAGLLDEAKLSRDHYVKNLPALRGASQMLSKATFGLFPALELPDEPTEDAFPVLDQLSSMIRAQTSGDDMVSVSAGGAVVNKRTGQEMYRAPFAPPRETPPQIGTAGHAISVYAQSLGKTPEQLTPNEYNEALRQYRDNTQRPPSAASNDVSWQRIEVLNDAGESVIASYNPKNRETLGPDGQVIRNPRPIPSAMASNDARKFKQAKPILESMASLSERINTQQGVVAKISGAIEKQKAQLNLNDDVAEYNSIIAGFTPLVARAVGHTGVLTQQDVDSVRELFPKPGDSKSLRDRKVARVMEIINAVGATASASAVSPGAAPAVVGPNKAAPAATKKADPLGIRR